MTDWLAFSRDCVRDLEGVLEELPTRVEREPVFDDVTVAFAAGTIGVASRQAVAAATSAPNTSTATPTQRAGTSPSRNACGVV